MERKTKHFITDQPTELSLFNLYVGPCPMRLGETGGLPGVFAVLKFRAGLELGTCLKSDKIPTNSKAIS